MPNHTVQKHMSVAQERDLRMFQREVAILRFLEHPNVIAYIDASIVDDARVGRTGILVTEYACGKTVEKWVEAHMDDNALRHILWFPFSQTLLNALEYLHTQRVHHLDLKPNNIMVYPEKRCLKVIDFGLSCGRSYSQYPEEHAGQRNDPWAEHDEACGLPGMTTRYTPWYNEGNLVPSELRYIDLYMAGGILHFWWFGDAPYQHMSGTHPFAWLFFMLRGVQETYAPTIATINEDSAPEIAPDDRHSARAALQYLLCNRRVGDCAQGQSSVLLPPFLKILAPEESLWMQS
jgi:serine/threonine protein kinase